MKQIKIIRIDWNSLKGIRTAESEKFRLENDGWELVHFTANQMMYQKKSKNNPKP